MAVVEPALARAVFSPLAMGSLKLWLRPDFNVSNDGAIDLNGSSQYLSIAHGSQSGLTLAGTSFTIAFWFAADAATGDDFVLSKYKWSTNERAYTFMFRQATGRLEFVMSADGVNVVQVASAGTFSPPTGWLLVVARYNIAAPSNQMRLSVNNGTVTQGTLAGGAFAGTTTAPFVIGADSQPGSHFDGRVDSAAVWNRELSDAEAATLYNSGAGRAYGTLPPELLSGLVSWWGLDESTGNRLDAHGGNHLTPTGAPPRAAGVALETPADEEAISLWRDQLGGGRLATQANVTRRPTRESTGLPLPLVQFDGTDDYFDFDPALNLSGGFTLAWLARVDGAPGTVLAHGSNAAVFVRHVSTTSVQISDGTNTRTFTHSAPGGAAVHVIVGDGSGLAHYMNGVASSASGTSFGAIDLAMIGARSGIVEPFNGLLGDIVAVGRAVSSDERNRLGRWLAGRARLSWSG